MAGIWESMTPGRVVLAVFTILLANVIKSIIVTRYFHPLSKFPGPFWASVTRLWISYQNLTGEEYVRLYELHKKYGPVIRITPTMLMCSDPKMLPIIYHSRADKADHYVAGCFGKTPSVFNIQPHKVHAAARKKIAQPYSMSHVKPMEPLVDELIIQWVEKIDKDFVSTGKKIDLAPWATYFAYDVISKMAFGKELGFVNKGYDIDNLIVSFHEGLAPFGVMSRLYPVMKALKDTWIADKFLVPKSGDPSGIGNIMKFRDEMIDARLEENEKHPENVATKKDLLQSFLNARDVKDGIDMEDLKAETLLMLLAGSDTTATAFQATLIEVMTHPAVYTRMMSEILSAPLSTPPTFDEVTAHCPYYLACIKEAMRLTPAAPNMFPRVVAQGGLWVEGKFVPEGTEMTCNPYITHRNKALYGEDAEVYRPERWLENEEKVKEWEVLDFGFGFGSRKCLGQNIALIELHKAPLEFFRRFKTTLVNPEKPADYIVAGGVSRFANCWLQIERR